MHIDDVRKELKPLIKKAQRRRLAILKRGLRSEAFDRAMSALNDNGFWQPKKTASLGELVRYKNILNKFLNAKTSTIKGIKKANAEKKAGFKNWITQTFGYKGDTEELYNALGGIDVNELIKSSNFDSTNFFNEMVISAKDGTLNQFINDMLSNLPFDGSTIYEGGEWIDNGDTVEFLIDNIAGVIKVL